MKIPLRHTLNHPQGRETVTKLLQEHNRRRRESLVNVTSLQTTLSTTNGEGGTKIRHYIFLDERLERKKIHPEPVTTLGGGAFGVSQRKIWLQKVRNSDLSYQDVPPAGRSPLTQGPQPTTFLEKYPFGTAEALAQYFFTAMLTTYDIIHITWE
jgi:hypothetical protein